MSQILDRNSVVELNKASISQFNDQPVLTDVNFSIGAGELVFLVGKTGSGKSSLLKTLYGALPLSDGFGKVAGFELKGMSKANVPDLRRKLGIVFQDFQLLTDRTISDNLEFVLRATGWTDKAKIKQRISDALEWVDLPGKEQKMPHEISGGEQQRVVIARALLNDPEIVLADEPTGNLDPETSEATLSLLTKLCTQRHAAVLIATHDFLLMGKFPARIIRCEAGKVYDDKIFEY
jgi:cell division transport system ATP-binding protein